MAIDRAIVVPLDIDDTRAAVLDVAIFDMAVVDRAVHHAVAAVLARSGGSKRRRPRPSSGRGTTGNSGSVLPDGVVLVVSFVEARRRLAGRA